jgi:hypothetical protein
MTARHSLHGLRSVQRCRLCHAANLAGPLRREKLLRRLGEVLLAGFEGLQGVERWQRIDGSPRS